MERRCKNRELVAPEVPRCVVHDLPDELLRLILLRLDSPLWLVRAACACKWWRRVVDGGDGGRAFLRLARSLHPPIVVGRYHNYVGGCYRFVPSSPMPICLSSFDLDFFPRCTIDRWQVADCHGGLVLLHDKFCIMSDSDLVVCDPLSRRYRDICHPPGQASSQIAKLTRVFLLDGGNEDDGDISISNFRVLYYCSTYSDVTEVYVFSSADGGGWRFVRQSTAEADDHGDPFSCYTGNVIGRIDKSLYMASLVGRVRVLDNACLEFSKVDLHIRARKSGLYYDYSTFAVVHGASPEPTAASPVTACIIHVRGENLELFRQIAGSGEWVLEHSIPRLSEATRGLQGHQEPCGWRAVDVVAGGTRLAVLRVHLSGGNWLFSLDVDTMQLQAVPDVATYLSPDTKPIIYTLPWPQFLNAGPS